MFLKRLALFVLAGVAAAHLTGCGTVGYYSQAVRGQYQIFSSQQPIDRLIADEETCPKLRGKLETVVQLRRFAEEELGLPGGEHYSQYADLKRKYVVWNVTATPEFSLHPKTWWYPVVGRLSHRGYFSEAKARRFAAELERAGYDVSVGRVEAYSTLGWFRDPVLNTFINNADHDLADLLFHELAHHRFFVKGDTAFNEAFATAVAEEGLRRWMLAAGNTEAFERYVAEKRRNEQFVGLVQQGRQRMAAVCQTATPEARSNAGSLVRLRAEKAAVFAWMREEHEQLKSEWGGKSDYHKWFETVNNAKLNAVATYHDLVPGFLALLRAHNNDLETFYREVQLLAQSPQRDRRQELARLRKTEELAALAQAPEAGASTGDQDGL